MSKQFKFQGKDFKSVECFGGAVLKGNARSRRPLDTKLPLHLVLRADIQKSLSMRNPRSFAVVNRLVSGLCAKYGIRLYQYANVGNHLHLLLRVPNRRLWARFIRELTGRIAQVVQGLRGRQKGTQFWLFKPFTRVIKGWGRAFKSIKDYVMYNDWEGDGNISRRDGLSLRELRKIWDDHWSPENSFSFGPTR